MKNTPLFSKGQRIAIVLLLFLIVAIWLADSLIARFTTPPEAHHEEALLFQAELDSFSAKIKPINVDETVDIYALRFEITKLREQLEAKNFENKEKKEAILPMPKN